MAPLLALILTGCMWLEGYSECKPACDKVFDEAQCAVDIGVIDHTAVTACVSQCGEQAEAVRDEWIFCVAGATCAEMLEGECLDSWVTGSGGPTGSAGEEIVLDTGE